jgi:hypothetical protein
MQPSDLLRIAAQFRKLATMATEAERADLLYLAEEYEASARAGPQDKLRPFSVQMPN